MTILSLRNISYDRVWKNQRKRETRREVEEEVGREVREKTEKWSKQKIIVEGKNE